jgi:DNA-binding CsgD family transcriptional regulator
MEKIGRYYRLEQLARLGLPNQIFIRALLQELHHEMPSLSNTFCWQNAQGMLSNIYDEIHNTETSNKLIVSMASNKPDIYGNITNWISQLDHPATPFNHYGKDHYVATFYKTILNPIGYYNSCLVPVRQAVNNKRLGVLMVHRQQGTADFTEDDCHKLQHISTIIAHGLSQTNTKHLSTTDGWEQGLLLIDLHGNLQHACSTGNKLLSLASCSRFDVSTKPTENDLYIFGDLNRLITNLTEPDNHKQAICDPTLTMCNAWGEFKLRGFLIKDLSGNRANQIGLNIRWQEPFLLKLFHRIRNLTLTPRQETVGLLYAAGDPHQTIADKLNLSLYTVKEHVGDINERLNIHSRADLIELIICDKSSD